MQDRGIHLAPDSTDSLTGEIIGAAITVHEALGPGLLESAYQACLRHELGHRGIAVESEVAVPLEYRGLQLECGYRIDLLVCGAVVVEVKSVEKLLPVHEAQLLTYLRLARKSKGLLLNFNSPYLRDGIKRMVL
ncbi:MAG: GxxExxY protein [Phycisphaeraceae bacterium]|nr:MAG: GxxExxY protein [Phycisphaeraceae bacterium]